jgi:transposase
MDVHGMMEVMDVVDTGLRRWFSDGEKVRIVEESLSGKNIARATARRYGVALSGLYLWRHQYQPGELGGLAPRRPIRFLPGMSAAPALAAPDGGDKIEVAYAERAGASGANGRPPGRPCAVDFRVELTNFSIWR